ncbi:hypothetical protein [Streptomyces mirabilis]|uniref:hypothetical protein n=1 Tax=Streptomyces mirabilis TaxID=68239 RepID=UPI0033B69C96
MSPKVTVAVGTPGTFAPRKQPPGLETASRIGTYSTGFSMKALPCARHNEFATEAASTLFSSWIARCSLAKQLTNHGLLGTVT